MKWALFFLAEYMHMITGCAFFAVLFLGGWDLIPFASLLPAVADGGWIAGLAIVALKLAILAGKVTALLFVMMWVRWTLPRLRFDQLMRIAWRGLIPITITLLLINGVMSYLNIQQWWWFALANATVAVASAIIGPMLPQGTEVNRRVGLEGSRFSPPIT